jgi:hypothetical protein
VDPRDPLVEVEGSELTLDDERDGVALEEECRSEPRGNPAVDGDEVFVVEVFAEFFVVPALLKLFFRQMCLDGVYLMLYLREINIQVLFVLQRKLHKLQPGPRL